VFAHIVGNEPVFAHARHMAKREHLEVGSASDLNDEALELIATRFRVLGESSRLKLIRALEGGELSVSDLIEKTGLTQANASRHLQTLTLAGILGRRRVGTRVIYHIADPGIFQLCKLVCGSLQTLLARHTSAFTTH
jgi:DNA-binding transcriptional ArsR family regulator